MPGEYPFCYFFRGYLPGVYSSQMVVKDFLALKGKALTTPVLQQIKDADVIVFQRPKDKETLELVRALKERGKKIIFENDDTYDVEKNDFLQILETDKQREAVKSFDSYIKQILRISHGAIASTEILAEEYRKINPNVVVLKNCIDPLDEFTCKKNETGKFRVGFIGSVTTNDDYVHIKDQIRELDARGDITIVILGVKYKDGSFHKFMTPDHEFWSSLKNVEWHPYVPVTEYMIKLASLALDLAIIPRKENYFNRCKSNLKFLEMSLLRIPVIAQGFSDGSSPYQGVDKDYLTIVENNTQWSRKIVEIKENYLPYKELANKAHDYVLENYNIKSYAKTWTNEIEKLCK